MASVIRWGAAGLGLIALIWIGNVAMGRVTSWLDMSLMPHTEEMMHTAILFGTLAYVVLLALPFVPGAEIGLTLLTVLGGTIAPLVYLATATSLTIAYVAGRMLPATVLARALAFVGLKRASALVAELSEMSEDEIRDHLLERGGTRIKGFMLKHRYIGLALTFNLPGNAIIGGGGGIALMAGLSRMFRPLPFVLTVLVAVLPVPLAFYVGSL